MTIGDLIGGIVAAVIRQEGRDATCTNPGDLEGCPWLRPGQPMEGRFWNPATRAIGIAGLAHVIALHIAQGNSLTDFIAGHPGVYAGFAPGADHNDPVTYICNVQAWSGIDNATRPLWEYINE